MRGADNNDQTDQIACHSGENPAHTEIEKGKVFLTKLNIARGESKGSEAFGQPRGYVFADVKSIDAVSCELIVSVHDIAGITDSVE